MDRATFAGGCFWCLEAVFQRINGVKRVVSGYIGGHTPNPDYRSICSGTTGHAEAVQIDYDPDQVDYETLLDVFFATHDPTTLNRQGNDSGTQYRSAVFVHDEAQRQSLQAKLAELAAGGQFSAPIVTETRDATTFYAAEAEHNDYFNRHPNQPYCMAVVLPKVRKLHAQFAQLTRSDG
ncbi:peptide methionine sulfoxide reductase MsrA [Jeongeupia sp. HS-3]|uniref:peptide-methionine (S)-S-oxide reductase MsrA n=1 Tax=Jeongeupia sp. HS-3 TaxID=1009682 RepID=UPI0018A5FE2E|nr:peptide-methionine (S)-S-oxide reductase MsrA [Jeongeupia sp. HS-3]BCL75262.1 peptide methionine sulfoxide reductase MsrA [Jeongeupia sp. HS-3]